MIYPPNIEELAVAALAALRAKNMKIVTAESCTGGLIAGALTEIAGSSDVFDRGYVSYSYESKDAMLGVTPENLLKFGAVSAETAETMAAGALAASTSHIAVAVTGIAGPGGGTPEKPVGLVYMGIAVRGKPVRALKNNFSGDRSTVRIQTVEKALREIIAACA